METAYHNDPQTRRRKIECKPELVIASLQRFYAQHPDVEKVLQYLNGEAPLSLRMIDWFVTKHSRKAFVRYPLNGHDFLVYLSYKGQLKAYSKQYFDPNCRRERIMFVIPNHPALTITVGKLNFFKWALECGVLDYMEAHAEEIRTGYNEYLKDTMGKGKAAEVAEAEDEEPAKAAEAEAAEAEPILMRNKTAKAGKSEEGVRTTRRRTRQTPSAMTTLQMVNAPIVLEFT
jgi:hypothetical protein